MTRKQTRNTDRNTDGPALRVLAAGALIVASACAAPILATDVATTHGAGEGARAPVQCGIAIDSLAGTTTFRPWVRLDRVMPGQYSFALSGGGTEINQGGGFEVGPGGQALLGQASVSGPPSRYDAELTVTVDGALYHCQLEATDI